MSDAYNVTMDTIIYLYHSRETTEFVTEKWQEKHYCLIRLGVPSLLWKNMGELGTECEMQDTALYERWNTGQACVQKQKEADRQCRKHKIARMVRAGIGALCAKLHLTRTHDSKENMPQNSDAVKLQREQERLAKRLAERKRFGELLEELKDLQTVLPLLGENPHWTYCVYEDFLREKMFIESLHAYWNIPEFESYHDYLWVQELMQYTVPGYYLILGYAACLPEILRGYVGRMRGLKWFLKPEQYTLEVEDFIEEFYVEYGLAVEVHLVGEAWNRVRPGSAVPVNVLDFTGEEKLSAYDVADGSIWVDMDSIDGKNRRMEARNPGITYFSLKKQWKQRQKEGICLDTVGKNGYNTIVK